MWLIYRQFLKQILLQNKGFSAKQDALNDVMYDELRPFFQI